jgi:hypothetical protein
LDWILDFPTYRNYYAFSYLAVEIVDKFISLAFKNEKIIMWNCILTISRDLFRKWWLLTMDVIDQLKGFIECAISSFIIGAILGMISSIFTANSTSFDIVFMGSLFGTLGVAFVKGSDDNINESTGMDLAVVALFGIFAAMFTGGFAYGTFTGVIDNVTVVGITTGVISGATSNGIIMFWYRFLQWS